MAHGGTLGSDLIALDRSLWRREREGVGCHARRFRHTQEVEAVLVALRIEHQYPADAALAPCLKASLVDVKRTALYEGLAFGVYQQARNPLYFALRCRVMRRAALAHIKASARGIRCYTGLVNICLLSCS